MAHRVRNNKWTRMIAARKLAAAAAAAAAAAPPNASAASAEGAAAPGTDAAAAAAVAADASTTNAEMHTDIASNVTDIGHPEEPRRNKEACTVSTATMLPLGEERTSWKGSAMVKAPKGGIGAAEDVGCAASNASRMPAEQLDAADAPCAAGQGSTPAEALPELSTSVDQLPCVLEASFVPSSATGLSDHYISYVLRGAVSQSEAEGSGEMTAFGVYDRTTEGRCLQLVRWDSARRPLRDETPDAPCGSDSAAAASPSFMEVVMYVDEDGRCFTLAPSSVFSVYRAQKDGSSALLTKGGDGENSCAYWLIPSFLKDHFLALLHAERTWMVQADSTNGAAAPIMKPFMCHVQAHETRWASTADAVAAVAKDTLHDHISSPGKNTKEVLETSPQVDASYAANDAAAAACSPLPVKRGRGRPRKRCRWATTTTASAPSAAPSCSTANTVDWRIPYVAKVVLNLGATARKDNESAAEAADALSSGVSSVLFYVANRLSPFPSDYVL